MSWDYIIVGQGLAGSVLSYTMLSKGKKVLVLDDSEQPKASLVAAGMYNPFTGRNMVKSWMVDILFPFLRSFYLQLGHDLQTQLLYPTSMYRPLISTKEQNDWSAKIHDPAYSSFIQSLVRADQSPEAVKSPWGGLFLKNCGFVDTGGLIRSYRLYLESRNCYRSHRFQHGDLQIRRGSIIYQGETAKKIIFCEGPNLATNPSLNWLPLRPVKGETLLVELAEPLSFIVNRGIFVLPIDGAVCKVGSTFDHKAISWEPSTSGKLELETKLQNLINIPYKLLDQKAGIRPATKDRRPFIGLHPQHEPLGIFNGLGTKGVSLAPYFAQEFFEFLERGKPLLNDVSINRYF